MGAEIWARPVDPAPGVTLPPEWTETDRETADYLLNVLPPVWVSGGYMVSEPVRHDAAGYPVYTGCTKVGGRYYVTECTVREWPGRVHVLHTVLGGGSAV